MNTFHGGLTAVAKHADGTEFGVRINDDAGRSVSVDTMQGGLEGSVTAKPRHGESGNLELCRILIARLNQDGHQWAHCDCADPSGRVDDVDCVLSDLQGDSVNVQITRITPDGNVWKAVAKGNRAAYTLQLDRAVDQLRTTIESKARKLAVGQRNALLLALDAIETGGYAFNEVVDAFGKLHGKWAHDLGFRSIWVVGPTVELTRQLDKN